MLRKNNVYTNSYEFTMHVTKSFFHLQNYLSDCWQTLNQCLSIIIICCPYSINNTLKTNIDPWMYCTVIYTAKCATYDNYMVLDSYDNHMAIIWYLKYDSHMITIWLSYVNFGLKTYDNHMFVKNIWLSYDNHAIIICQLKHMIIIWCSIYMIIIWCKPYDSYVWHICLCT